MSNVIDFNSAKLEMMKKRFDELTEQSVITEEVAADFAISAVMDIVEAASELGFDVMQEPDVIRDVLLVMESIRGLIHRIDGNTLEINDISDKMFSNIENTESALKNFLAEFSDMT